MGDQRHTVKQGDSVENVAVDTGHFWETIWDYGPNGELRELRPSPHVLMEGDLLVVPDIVLKHIDLPTDEQHVFRRRGVPSRLRVQFKENGEPRAGAAYTIELGEEVREGVLDADGYLDEAVWPTLPTAVVRFQRVASEEDEDDDFDEEDDEDDEDGDYDDEDEDEDEDEDDEESEEVFSFRLRGMDPSSTVSGAQSRLKNLGYSVGAIDGDLGEKTAAAFRAFQKKFDLEVSGELDSATQAKLSEITPG